MRRTPLTDDKILDGFIRFNSDITKKYFYGYCRKAYDVFDYKYQLKYKPGLDFYSLAHEYYIQLLTHGFRQLLDKPEDMKLSTWMTGGFRFVVLDAIKAFNKDADLLNATDYSDIVDYIRSSEYENMMADVAEAVASHYHDRIMQEIAYLVLYAGYKQKEVAAELGMTPAAINQRYKKMMEEVITPFVIENYSTGIDTCTKQSAMFDDHVCYSEAPSYELSFNHITGFEISAPTPIMETRKPRRVSARLITSLRQNEIFVFGSNLQGIHAGGAARTARLHFGAEMGNGVGIQGQSYAIPTMQGGVETIRPYVDEFIKYAHQHPDQNFLVTEVGCGIAGFEPSDIAPLFKNARVIDNIFLPQSFWDVIDLQTSSDNFDEWD